MADATEVQRKNYEKYLIGKELYEQLASEEDTQFIVCPVGIGDTINIASLAKAYKEVKHIEKLTLVVRPSHEQIARLFDGVDDVRVVDVEHIECMQGYMYMTGEYDEKNVLYGHFRLNRKLIKGESGEVRQIMTPGLTYFDAYKVDVLGIPVESKATAMNICPDNSEETVAKYEGAVLLAPYADTFRMLPADFWKDLAKAYLEQNIKVYTNVKNMQEQYIKGTQPICLSLGELADLAHHFKKVVALRSGMCDVTAFAKCPLDILYPYNITSQADECTMDDAAIICDVRNLHNRDGIHTYICHEGNKDKLINLLLSE